jgi:hypothetical protein
MNKWLERLLHSKQFQLTVKVKESMQVPLSETEIRNYFACCADIIFQNQNDLLLVYCIGLVKTEQINKFVGLEDTPMITEYSYSESDWQKEISAQVFSGVLVIYHAAESKWYTYNVASFPQRKPEESMTETSIKGARDGFTESIETNMALIRMRLRTTSLSYEKFVIGKRSMTEVGLVYIRDIANVNVINEARSRLQKINVEALITSALLEEAVSDQSFSLIPLIDNTGRPDFTAECLLNGRFAILMNGAPLAILAPIGLFSLVKSPEDGYFRSYIVNFQRLLRVLGLWLSVFLPGFYIALMAYNFEQVPMPLLATTASNRVGLPLPIALEAFLVLIMFELFKEAGLRLPKTVGPMVTVVGGLIIGDVAIRAGLTAPTLTVVIGTTVMAGYTLVNPTLSVVVSILRIFILLSASFLGMFGFIISIVGLTLYTSSLESFGVSILAPLSPMKFRDVFNTLFKSPASLEDTRPQSLGVQDSIRQKREES